jgi:outer membrane protein assembly factor BamB
VAGGRVFVTDRRAADNVERVLAFDQETGQPLWSFQYPVVYADVDYASGPRVTPTVDGNRVYIKGAMGNLLCLMTEDGQVIWSHDLVSRFNARIPTWGAVGAPLVDGDALIVNVGGESDSGVVAFDKFTGAVRWQVLSDRPGYAPPFMIHAGGARQLIYWSAEGINSLDPKTGSSYWRIPFTDRADMTICAPVLDGDYLFFSSYYGGSMMLELAHNRPAATIVWRDKRGEASTLALCISTPIFKGRHLYGIDRSGSLRCLEVSTGKIVWESTKATGGKPHGNAHITPNGKREFLFNEAGELIITELSPAGYGEVSRTHLIAPTAGVKDHRPVVWSHPAYADRHIFIRNDEELRCISLAAESD